MKTKIEKVDLGIVIGRFQPFHNGHLELVKTALQFSRNVLVLVGSSNRSRSPKNPFTYKERYEMIHNAIHSDLKLLVPSRVMTAPIKDFLYEDNRWLEQVQATVRDVAACLQTDNISLFAHDRDDTSWYVHKFPAWGLVQLPSFHEDISATQVREALFDKDAREGMLKQLPTGTLKVLNSIKDNEASWLMDYWRFAKDYYAKVNSGPYEYIRHTVDSVVTCKGHILLIQRKNHPGLGLWALPGGHLNPRESLKNAAVRELYEETNIGIKSNVLWNAMTGEKAFDHPDRSSICRTITTAYHFPLNTGDLPLLKAGDDAADAKWVTFAEFELMRNDGMLIEDHGDIGSYYIRQS